MWFLRRKFSLRIEKYQHLYRRVLGRVRRNMREAVTLMTLALVGRGRRNVRGEEDVLDTVHDNPSASTRHFSCSTGRRCQRASPRSVCGSAVYPFHPQPVQGLQTYISVYSFLDGCTLKICAVEGHDG
jgi:hypothetical protein